MFSTAGVLRAERHPAQLCAAAVRATLDTNLVGPLLAAKHLHAFVLPRAPPPSVWVNMSARVGSIGDNAAGGWYSYRASKAGLNQVTRCLDLFLAQRCGAAAMAVSIHPGTVRTALSADYWASVPEGSLFEPEDAAAKVLDVVEALRPEQRGGFWDWKGERIEW